MATPVILIEVAPRAVADGAAQTVRLAGGGAELPYYYGGQHWRGGIASFPSFITSLDFGGTDLGTGGVPTATEVSWAPSAHDDLAAMAALVWFDAPITVRIGPEGAMPPVVLTGKVLDAKPVDGKLRIALADPAASLKKPLLTARWAGTGGLEGPVEWTGAIKRRVWGRVWNQRGEPIDKANNIYCFADPTRPIQSFDAVRDKGAAAAALTVLAGGATPADTFAALQGAVAPQGGGVVCPSIACVKWWTEPAGDLHADLRGEIGAGYVETTATIAQRLVSTLGGPAFAAGAIAAADAARPAPVGWTANDDSTTVAAMLDELLRGSSLLWVLNSTGEIEIRQWAWGAPVASAQSHQVVRRTCYRPMATRKLGYRRNESPMDRGAIVAIVFADTVAYLDGTLAETLQPAEAGATLGAPLGTPVGDIDAGDVSATVNPGGGVADNQVNTTAVQDEAITSVQQAYNGTGAAGAGTAAWITLITFNVVMETAGDIVVIATAKQAFGSGEKDWQARLKVDGVEVFATGGTKFADSIALSGKGTIAAAGTYAVSLEWAGQDSSITVSASGASLISIRRYR
ncbi:MAG TPA: hypothetical protein PLM58_14860 [Novosphingobium sp.]|nr:hypothetical protein [Novosphingobium sp.]